MGARTDHVRQQLATLRGTVTEAQQARLKAEDALAALEEREARRAARSGSKSDLAVKYPALRGR